MWAAAGWLSLFALVAAAFGLGHPDDWEEPVVFDRFRAWYSGSDAARRAWRTFYQAFLVLFIGSLVTWLTAVQEWATCIDACKAFPDPGVLGKAAVAAVSAAAISTFTLAQVALEVHGKVKDRR